MLLFRLMLMFMFMCCILIFGSGMVLWFLNCVEVGVICILVFRVGGDVEKWVVGELGLVLSCLMW